MPGDRIEQALAIAKTSGDEVQQVLAEALERWRSGATAARAALAELVAAVTAPDAFPAEREETPFGDSITLLENPRITSAIRAAQAALRSDPESPHG